MAALHIKSCICMKPFRTTIFFLLPWATSSWTHPEPFATKSGIVQMKSAFVRRRDYTPSRLPTPHKHRLITHYLRPHHRRCLAPNQLWLARIETFPDILWLTYIFNSIFRHPFNTEWHPTNLINTFWTLSQHQLTPKWHPSDSDYMPSDTVGQLAQSLLT